MFEIESGMLLTATGWTSGAHRGTGQVESLSALGMRRAAHKLGRTGSDPRREEEAPCGSPWSAPPTCQSYCRWCAPTATSTRSPRATGSCWRLSRALLADPEREGLQLLARDDAGRAVGFATLYWTWQTLAAARVGVMNDLFVAPEARGMGWPRG